MHMEQTGIILNIAVHAGLLTLLTVLLVRYFLSPFAEVRTPLKSLLTAPSASQHRLHAPPRIGTYIGYVILLFTLSRLMFLLIGGLAQHFDGYSRFPEYLKNLSWHWTHWDAPHYIKLAENGYVAAGDDRLLLVFYPLYPLLIRVLRTVLRSTVLSAFVASNACLLGSGALMYRIVYREFGRSTARRSVFFLMFAPLSFYFSVPYTESLFLLTTLAAVDLAQQRRWGWALTMGALSALTRSLGLLTAVAVFYEMLVQWKGTAPALPAKQLLQGRWLRFMGLRALLCCTIALGFGAYLLLNWQVSGNPLQFLEYQSSHWSQNFGSVWYTFTYSFENALTYSDLDYRAGVWIPQVLYLLSIIGLSLACASRIRPGYGAYALLYVYMAYAPTWLLSGPRYLTAMFALYPMLAMLSRRKPVFYGLAALSLLGCALLTWEYHTGGCLL